MISLTESTEYHALSVLHLQNAVKECRDMIAEIEVEILTQYMDDEEEHLRYVQLDALVYLIKTLSERIKEKSYLFNW